MSCAKYKDIQKYIYYKQNIHQFLQTGINLRIIEKKVFKNIVISGREQRAP